MQFRPDDPDYGIAKYLKICKELSSVSSCLRGPLWVKLQDKLRDSPGRGLQSLMTDPDPGSRIKLYGRDSKTFKKDIASAVNMRSQARDVLDFAKRAERDAQEMKGLDRQVWEV